ncbi:SIR2 family protein [bacterium]|nr:SIR2 family protein [bacterium]
MIDPIISLAFSTYSNPGVYALLLGSGVSRSAGIPTGWEIVLDLIKKVASLQGEDCKPDPEKWYVEKFGKEPDYSKLLEDLAKPPTERSYLLRPYFEPNEEEKEQGLKTPTEAHKAIAKLVAGGYVRVIITTNFDRLLEKALEEIGVSPTVISTPDAVEGAVPITHTKCTVIKINGDYLDGRIKNTQKELEHYDDRINNLLDRVFDGFGLIICGWSAEWDIALRTAIERCKNHRFSTYWTVHGKSGEMAKSLITLRRAEIIPIRDADAFFGELAEKVFALEDIDRSHPLSAKVAIAMVKKYLMDNRHISLHDLVRQETEEIFKGINNPDLLNKEATSQRLYKRMQQYEASTEILRDIFITGCYWGDQIHEDIWVKSLNRLVNPGIRQGNTVLLKLRLYPALILLYSGGIAAFASEKYHTFASLLTHPKICEIYSPEKSKSLFLGLHPLIVMDKKKAQGLHNMKKSETPLSDYLSQALRDPFREYLPDDREYEDFFDRFEYLMALVYMDLKERESRETGRPISGFTHIGRFARQFGNPDFYIIKQIEKEIKDQGSEWPLLKIGFFGASVERLQEVKSKLDEELEKLNWWASSHFDEKQP